ncbi:hypothetical protein INH39_03925 [Massilia violaceinigra]|uniref:DUF4262 domain-containing protein n=1 Tax=Massilia violaceinigra TaxID=2045208 RepID=A0ABY4A954_9BURK|nr:hypothetical protein [Massilia violaceinigra]UOD30892.1 hypothetical protein INH39_03925 [Massilia violaceinigra]
MDVEEIEKYVSLGSRRTICAYRERLPDIDLYVMSIYITGKPGNYSVSVEFDPVTMVDEGEGWMWHSESMQLEKIIELLEKFNGKDISEWENVTKSGRLEYFTCESNDLVSKEQDSAFEAIRFGEKRLPEGFVWRTTPFDMPLTFDDD